MRKERPKYTTLFFFDRTVPRELYYKIQRRLNIMGYGAVWQPNSAMRGARNLEEICTYCKARGIKIIASFYRDLRLPKQFEGELLLLHLKGGRHKSVNKIISLLFSSLRRFEREKTDK
ncbi:MAG: hypothetical protein DRO05_06200 [Thermoproteota archaeon]|nr:MAG: hypothetical protein DRO05_06200 [Candidatus Korarchaeota archaeon]